MIWDTLYKIWVTLNMIWDTLYLIWDRLIWYGRPCIWYGTPYIRCGTPYIWYGTPCKWLTCLAVDLQITQYLSRAMDKIEREDMKTAIHEVDFTILQISAKELDFFKKKLKFSILISLQSDGVKLWYFKI